METKAKQTYSTDVNTNSVNFMPPMLLLRLLRSGRINILLWLVLGICCLHVSLMLLTAISHQSNTSEAGEILHRQRSNMNPQNIELKYTNGSQRTNYTIPAVDKFVMKFQLRYTNNSLLKLDPHESYNDFLRRLNLRRKKGVPLVRNISSPANNSAEKYHRGINQFYMYDPDDVSIQALLQDMVTLPIIKTEVVPEGNQLKFALTFADGSDARVKVMRQTVDRTNRLDWYNRDFFEHYQAEIAGFHLDKVLGFHRAVPTVGRVLNMTTMLSTWGADKSRLRKVYRSHTGNLCFILRCLQYCDRDNPLCGHGDALPGALSAELPNESTYYRHLHVNPYKGSYIINETAKWETDNNYCNSFVKKKVSFYTLLEFMDLAAYNYLTGAFCVDAISHSPFPDLPHGVHGNLDLHSYLKFRDMEEDTFVIVFDSGRGFSQPTYDQMSILAPIRQCCLIRLSTLAKFIKLYKGPDSLSSVMDSSLKSDPLYPVLTEADLDALDRRVAKVIKIVGDCVAKARSWDDVVFDDLNIH